MEDMGIAGKLFLPIAIVTAALMMPTPEPAVIELSVAEWPDMPAPVVNVDVPEFPAYPEPTIVKPSSVTVQPSEPVIVEKRVEVPGPTVTVYEDREVIVDRIVEVPACIDFDDLPYFDLPNAISVTRPGEAWSLSGDYYNGLAWSDSTTKPTFTEIVGGWLSHLEDQCG
jgi:hypothetical protein